jgi:hypothetical protein
MEQIHQSPETHSNLSIILKTILLVCVIGRGHFPIGVG